MKHGLLFNEPLYLVCRTSDPLASLSNVKLRDLDGQTFIHTVRSGSVWQHMRSVMSDMRVRDSGFEVAQFGTLAGLVRHGFGVSIVPHFALPLCARKGLTSLRLGDRKAVRPIYMIKRRGKSLSAAALELWDAIGHSVPQEMGLRPVTNGKSRRL